MDAIEKLKQEMGKASEPQKMVAQYLIMRCKDSLALCEDIMNPVKTLAKCWEYIYAQARKAAKSGAFMECGTDPKNSKVFEWAEDYYHAKDLDIDKPKPEPQKFDKDKALAKATASVAKSASKPAVKATQTTKKATVLPMPKKPEKPTSKPSQSVPKKQVLDMNKPTKKVEEKEQFSLFDFM